VTDKPAKPVPAITPELAPFFEAARRHQLVVQRCGGCGALRFPARPVCSACLSHESTWVPVSGRGKVFTLAIMHQAIDPGFAAEVPYAVVLVELDEGVRMITNVVDCPASEIEIGMPVEVVFEEVSPPGEVQVTLPKFRRVPSGSA
jgi:uncharacterized OB-fold protein